MAKNQRVPVKPAAVAGAQKELQEKAKADSEAIQQKINSAEKNSEALGEVLGDPRDESLGGPQGKDEQAAQLLASQDAPTLAGTRSRRKVVDAEMVDVHPLARGFNLTGDDGIVTTYEAGTTKMPRGHAEHWYAQAHGVQLK